MRLLLLLFLLYHTPAFTQIASIPFELERYSTDVYTRTLENRDTNFTTEIDALEYYFLAYKTQRAGDPENYFPRADKNRKIAETYLRSNFPVGPAVALIDFLESRGSEESCNALISVSSDYKILLSYQFIASYLLGDQVQEKQFLNKMDQANILSDVLKSFGENSMQSIQNNTTLISQGIQDLIAFKYAAYLVNSSVNIVNIFAENCESFKGVKINEIVAGNIDNILISPTISISFMSLNQHSLHLYGIGFALSYSDKSLAEMMWKTGRNFAGLTNLAKTPADRGLIQSYSYFAEAYQAYALEKGEDLDRSQSGKISQYIKNQIE